MKHKNKMISSCICSKKTRSGDPLKKENIQTLYDSFLWATHTSHKKISIKGWPIFMFVEWIPVAHTHHFSAALLTAAASFVDYSGSVLLQQPHCKQSTCITFAKGQS